MHHLAAFVVRAATHRSKVLMTAPTTMPRLLAMQRHLYAPKTAIHPGRPYSSSSDRTSPSSGSSASTFASPKESSLPSETESRRSALNLKFSAVMDNLQARALAATQTLNDVTGYSSIEAIKADNERTEQSLGAAQERVRAARAAYKTSNAQRAATQREVTTLLARKDSWSPTDLERFTELYRADHVLEGSVAAAQETLTAAEAEEQSLNQRLNAGILKRYHEEQIWSDRIRRASTWGTWGLMGMNFVLFVLLQFFAEPWRRRRLVSGVVEHEKNLLQGVRAEMEALRTDLERRLGDDDASEPAGGMEQKLSAAEAEAPTQTPPPRTETPLFLVPTTGEVTWAEFLRDPLMWKMAAKDLYSERRISLCMREASALVLQGAIAGAAVAGSIALLTVR